MSQILHIFRKDVRHHWIEILICQVALVAYCWNEVSQWGSQRINFRLDILSMVIGVLLPLSWCFLVFRIVQSETLVGDRQFWITRPYQWKKLLAEKALFVLVFLNVPLLIAGYALLIKAGFSPLPHVLGLLWMQVVLIQLPLLPFMALAAVTRNLGQGILALLVVVLYIVGMTALDGALTYLGYPPGDVDMLQGIVAVIACVIAVGLQYAQRKTGQARLWLAGGAFATVLLLLGNAHYMHGKEKYPLPSAGQTTSFHAALEPVKLTAPKQPPEKNEDVNFRIPLRLSGLPAGTLGRIRGIRVMLEAPDGFYWDSGWQGMYGLLQPQGNDQRKAEFSSSYKIYERLKSVPLKAHIAVAVAIFRENRFETISVTTGEFDVPGIGRCRVPEKNQNELRCHSPLVKPGMVVVRVGPGTSTCPDLDENQRQQDTIQYPLDWLEGSDSKLPDYGINPVESFQFNFFNVGICPRTPLTFSFPEFMENTRTDFVVDNVKLDEWRAESLFFGGHSIGLRVGGR